MGGRARGVVVVYFAVIVGGDLGGREPEGGGGSFDVNYFPFFHGGGL